MLDDVIDALRKQAVSYGVDIVYRLELKGISASKLVGDPHRLGQMIKHLVDNAIKSYDGQRKGAGPSGDGVNTVEIRVRVVNKQLWSRRDDNHLAGLARWNEVSRRDGLQVGTLTVEVEDHGKGIPDKEMKKLFTPFGQVEARGKSDGIGLGLAIVKQLADAMGGRVSCTSAEGVGSTFFIHNLTMPVSTKHTPHHYNLDEESVLIVAKPPLLHGLAHQLHSLWISPKVVDASCPEEFAEWLADSTASSSSVTSVSGRAVAHQHPRPENEVLIIDAQLLPQVRLAKLPYKRVITLSPPSKVKETVTDGPTRALVPEDLMRPVTRRTLRDVLVAVTGEREGSSGATPPLAVRAGLQQQQQAEGEARQASRCPFLVLVVDDNKVNLKVVGAMLRRLSVPFETANDGIEAIEQICKTRYDLVLMDLSMPRMGGLEATRIVRTIEKSTHEPPVDIVAMTAATSKEDEEECMRSGFTLYLPKPVKYGAVKDLIEGKQQEKQRRMREQEEFPRPTNALEGREEGEENSRSSS